MASSRRYAREREYEVAYDITYMRRYQGKSRNWPFADYATRRVYKSVKAHSAAEAESIVLGLKYYRGKDIALCGTRFVR